MATFTIDLLSGTALLLTGNFSGSGGTSGTTIGYSCLVNFSTKVGCNSKAVLRSDGRCSS